MMSEMERSMSTETNRSVVKAVEILRPESTRKESKEIFFVCKDYVPVTL